MSDSDYTDGEFEKFKCESEEEGNEGWEDESEGSEGWEAGNEGWEDESEGNEEWEAGNGEEEEEEEEESDEEEYQRFYDGKDADYRTNYRTGYRDDYRIDHDKDGDYRIDYRDDYGIGYEEDRNLDYEGDHDMEMDIDMNLSASLSRCSSAPSPVEDGVTANAIIESLQNVLPGLNTASSAPVRMTDIGYKISQVVLRQRRQAPAEETADLYLEKALSGNRRNRTGKRGRPKKIDHGFGKSTTQNLPPEIGRMMGQANTHYVAREYEEAIKALVEVIRRAPHAFEAYQTLGMVQEDKGDLDKAYSYYVIAAHLIKTNTELWKKLALLTLELNRPAEAIYYLGRLIRMRDALPEYFWTRARLWVEREEYRKATLGFHRLLLAEVEGDGQAFSQVAIFASRVDHGDLMGGIFLQVITQAINAKRVPSLEVIQCILGWLFEKKELDKIQVLIEMIAVPMVSEYSVTLPVDWFALEDEERKLVAVENLPVEIRLYYITAMVSLKKTDASLYGWVTDLDPYKYGLSMKMLGKTLLAGAHPIEALSILLPLMEVPELGDPDLGVLIGECYRLIPGQEEMAISTFEAVLAVCPERGDARTALCDLYRQQGQMDKATQVLKRENVQWATFEQRPVEKHPPFPVAEVFEGLFAWDSPMPSSSAAPARPLLQLRGGLTARKKKSKRRKRKTKRNTPFTEGEMRVYQKNYERILNLLNESSAPVNMRQAGQLAGPLIEDMVRNPNVRPTDKMKPLTKAVDLADLHGLTLAEWFDLLCRYLAIECHVGSVDRALRLVRMILSRSVFNLDPLNAVVLRVLYVGISDRTGRPSAVLQASRWFIRVWPNLLLSSNLVMRALWGCAPSTPVNIPFVRFMERLSNRNPGNPLLLATNLALLLCTERYEAAIRVGYDLLSILPDHLMGLLSTAVALLHQSTKRTCRAPALFQRRAFALLHHYFGIAGPLGEYNLARAYHMMGRFELAVPHYRRALKGKYAHHAAFNLHLLFIQNGEPSLAAKILERYLPTV